MKDQDSLRCTICLAERSAGPGWFVLFENRWTDRLKILSWTEALARDPGVHVACGIPHVQELVAHWMATGSLHYPFACVSDPRAMQARRGRRLDPMQSAEPDIDGHEVLGELAVHRESLHRILEENPESLAGILSALISALPQYDEAVALREEQPADEGVYELTGV